MALSFFLGLQFGLILIVLGIEFISFLTDILKKK